MKTVSAVYPKIQPLFILVFISYLTQFDMDVEKTEDCKVKLYAINTVLLNVSYTVNGDSYELEAFSKTHDPIKLERGMYV